MQEVSLVKEKGCYNLQNQTDFLISKVKSVNYDSETI